MKSKSMYKRVQKSSTYQRLPIPKEINWNDGDTIEFDVVNEDTVTLKRVLKVD